MEREWPSMELFLLSRTPRLPAWMQQRPHWGRLESPRGALVGGAGWAALASGSVVWV